MCRPMGEELWALLLEKAFAKLMGGYGMMDAKTGDPGSQWWAIQLMTGCSSALKYYMDTKGDIRKATLC